jgi:carbonic anhydrase-like protein
MAGQMATSGCLNGWRLSRRRLLKVSATGAGLALLSGGGLVGSLATAPRVYASGAIEALVLNCIDYRLVNEVTTLMNERRMTNEYDQMILAGATLGVATDKFPAWAQTFWEHLAVSVQLHQIKRVIAIDHRDCGAYKLAFNQDFGADPVAETAIHTQVMTAFQAMVKEKQPALEVETWLMALDGKVEAIGAAEPAPAVPAH